ncbi:MAG: hypothetical protein ABI629_19275 [bacterium]
MTRAPRRRRVAAVRLLLAASLACGCSATAPGGFSQSLTRSRVSQAGMPCTEAARVAQGALLRVGYVPEATTVPQPGTPGVVVSKRAAGYDIASNQASHYYTTTVTLTCSNSGADFDAITDEPLPGSLSFKTDFAKAIETVAGRRIQRPALAERPATGMVIAIEPLRGGEARSGLGVELPGVTTVRMKLENRTERTYIFSGDGVQMVTQQGDRVGPLDAAQTAKQVGAAAGTAASQRIADGVLAPKAVLSGFLYFPSSAYQRATVMLIDQETEEEEGFRVEF